MLIFVVFVGMLLINQGEMRIYVLLALLAGVVIYYRVLSQRLEKPITFAANSTVYIISKTIKITVKGLAYCRNFVKEKLKKDKGPPPDNEED